MGGALIDVSTTFVRNAWYVVAIAARPVVRRILDMPVFVYRGSRSQLAAMLDRCPHRRLPLSRSIIEDDGVRCRYHGIKFAPDGRCIDVPAQPGRCSDLRIRTFEVAEYADWVWVWAGDEPPSGQMPPRAPEFQPRIPWRRRQICAHHVRARASLFQDNLLDLSHLAFLHANNIGGSGVDTTKPDLKVTPFGLAVRRDVLDPAMARSPLGRAMGSFRVLQALTPESATTMPYFQACQRNFVIDDPATDAVLNLPIPEDVPAAELIEAELSKAKSPEPEIHIVSDVAALRGRALMQRAIEREANSASSEKVLADD